MVLTSKVAVVTFDEDEGEAYGEAVRLIGGLDHLDVAERPVVIKVGVYEHRAPESQRSSVGVVRAIIEGFKEAPKIYVVESDNYRGNAMERLRIYEELFDDRVVPFDLSRDPDTRKVRIDAGSKSFTQDLSHVLFKPSVFVDTHVVRSMLRGSILKNLFGCIPTAKKAKFHKTEVFVNLLADIYEAIGGIDLAVLDGTWMYRSGTLERERMNTLVVGRDALAVEAVGASLARLKIEKMPVLQEFIRRGLGEGDLNDIEIVGEPWEGVIERFEAAARRLEKNRKPAPRTTITKRDIMKAIAESLAALPLDVTLDGLHEEVLRKFAGDPLLGASRKKIGKLVERAMLERK
jgi:uncharacterized protein (DUF362 family)